MVFVWVKAKVQANKRSNCILTGKKREENESFLPIVVVTGQSFVLERVKKRIGESDEKKRGEKEA